MPKISVIVTTYNRKYEARRALDSIYAQTVQPDEVILVDDCSSDGTKEYIESFRFTGLRYFRLSDNRGPGAARNFGIMHSEGEYIAFLDSDNEWYPTKLEKFLAVLKRQAETWDIICSRYKKHEQFDCRIMPELAGEEGRLRENDIWWDNPADASSSVYRKSFLEVAGLFAENIRTQLDWELLLRAGRKGKLHIYIIDQVLTENWTMFDGLSEDKELERIERSKLFTEYEQEFFAAIAESHKEAAQKYDEDRKQHEEIERKYKAVLARKSSFYELMSRWMKLKLEGGSAGDNLKKKGYGRIAIYGAGRHGKLLWQDLKGSGVELAYFIDRNKPVLHDCNVMIYSPEESLPEVDAIVVSPYLELEEIRQVLENKGHYDLIPLDKLIEW